PDGELMSQSSPGSSTPLPHVPPSVVVVGGAVVEVVVVDTLHVVVVTPPLHVHCAVHVSPGAQVNPPPGEPPGSHCSPGSTVAFPQSPFRVVVVEPGVVVVVVVAFDRLHSGG